MVDEVGDTKVLSALTVNLTTLALVLQLDLVHTVPCDFTIYKM